MSASEPSVALELERLRGAVDTGFAKLNGRLDVALQRTSQTETDIEELKQEVEALKRARWPLPSLAAVTGLAAIGLTLYEISAR
ncbi:hypothetical protein QCN29_26720 [Streptomyces sp. HNM0663]|uniref:DUF3618 domain-containing protein n=1 Tax=Streptomyces chengmaiensis TaxID=3040919 RepID=A0ABT6HV91_9ACTN|nr:hypothetical protein [Streptomyces chengmaiensis]MDH2392305.1 hypothetical protein [Streptomyces chengmaiensis]